MSLSLRRVRRCRAVLVVLAVAWLPYISVRCVESSAHGCPIWTPSHGAAGRSQPEHEHPGHAHDGNAHEGMPSGGESDHLPARTCCELTGKYAFATSVPAPSAAPAAVLVRLCEGAEFPQPPLAVDAHRRVPLTAHAPPRYLRFATLLI